MPHLCIVWSLLPSHPLRPSLTTWLPALRSATPSPADDELDVELDEFAVSYKPQKISPKFPGTVGTSAAMLHCLPGCNSPEHCTQQLALALAITAGIHPLHSPLSAPAHWRRALPRALQVRELLHKRIRDSYLHPGFQADVMKPLTIEHLMDNEVQTLSGGELCCVGK